MLKTFVFIDTWFVKQDIDRWFINTIQYYMEQSENEKKNGKKIWPSGAGIWTPEFWVQFPPTIWIFSFHG